MKKDKVSFLTLNINSVNKRLESFKLCVQKHDPDIILLQEIKCENYKFPEDRIKDLGYEHIIINGQKSYNGVAILSKFALKNIKTCFDGNTFAEDARYIEADAETPLGEIAVLCIYCPNGSPVMSEKYHRKLSFFKNFKAHLHNLLKKKNKILIGGDINIAPYDIDVYSPNELQNSVAFTIEERVALREILNLGFVDCYRALNDIQEFSWFDYRGGSLEKKTGFRIDLFLASSALADYLTCCNIDIETRYGKNSLNPPEKPSDHCPVICRFERL